MTDSASKNTGRPTATNRDVVLIAAIAVSHLPMLVSYFYNLAMYDHYQFFPFALGGVGWLVWTRVDWSVFRCGRLGWCCIFIDLMLLAGSCFLNSPWMAAVGMALIVGVIGFSGVERPKRRVFEIPLLFLTVVRPPFGADIELIQTLQLLTSRFASGLLDRMGVLHVQSGNLIELSDKRLFVEEACSGVQSLFTLLFLAAAIVAWHRRPPLHAVLLLCMAPLCSIPMNTVRVMTVAVGWDSLEMDLTSGVAHDVVGYVLLAIATGLLISGDILIHFFSAPISDDWAVKHSRTLANPFVALWNRLWKNPRWRGGGLPPSRKSVVAVTSAAGVFLLALQCYTLFAANRSAVSEVTALNLTPPPNLGSFTYDSENDETRSRSSSMGKYSRIWTYQRDGLICKFSCDYPFQNWHALEVCYTGLGWDHGEKLVLDDEWPMVAFHLTRPTGEHAYLVYSLFEADGTPVRPPTISDPSAAFYDRIMKPGNWLIGERTIYQSQLFLVSQIKADDERTTELNNHHRTMRELMRHRFMTSKDSP